MSSSLVGLAAMDPTERKDIADRLRALGCWDLGVHKNTQGLSRVHRSRVFKRWRLFAASRAFYRGDPVRCLRSIFSLRTHGKNVAESEFVELAANCWSCFSRCDLKYPAFLKNPFAKWVLTPARLPALRAASQTNTEIFCLYVSSSNDGLLLLLLLLSVRDGVLHASFSSGITVTVFVEWRILLSAAPKEVGCGRRYLLPPSEITSKID